MSPRLRAGTRFLAVILFYSAALNFSALAQAPNPVGEWNLQSDAQGQITKFTLTITRVGEVLRGKVTSEAYGAQDLTDLKVENGTVTFTRNLDIGGQAIEMAFKGKIEGEKLTGAYSVQGIDLPVTGTRKPPVAGAGAK